MALLPKVKLKTVVSFPAAVFGGAGVAVRKENGNFYFDLDFSQYPVVASIPAGDLPNTNVLTYNLASKAYLLAPYGGSTIEPATNTPLVESGAGAVGVSLKYAREDHVHPAGGGGGGIPEAPNDGVQYGRQSLAWTPVGVPISQGRLYLMSGESVPYVTRSARTTMFYGPHNGNRVPIFDGTNMVPTLFAEISTTTTDTTKNPSAIGANKVNDWFVWNDAGTVRVCHGPDWTNETTRSAGTALTNIGGILCNSVAITNGPTAGRGTYVGTTRSNASSQLDWIFGASAAGGTAAFLGLWNMYNRVSVATTVTDSTASWVTTTSATPAPLDTGATGGGLNNRISAIFGLPQDGIRIAFGARLGSSGVAFAGCDAGFAMDQINAFDKIIHTQSTSSGLVIVISCSCELMYAPQQGFHFWQATQAGDGTNFGSMAGGLYEGLSGLFQM